MSAAASVGASRGRRRPATVLWSAPLAPIFGGLDPSASTQCDPRLADGARASTPVHRYSPAVRVTATIAAAALTVTEHTARGY
jgi:hypothetical protein